MKKFVVTFSKEIDVVVAAPDEMTREQLLKLANDTARREIDAYWDTGDWDVEVQESDARAKYFGKIKVQLGVHEGRLRDIDDCGGEYT